MLKIDFTLTPQSVEQLNALSVDFKKGLTKSLIEAMLFAEGKSKQIFKEGGPVLPPPGPLVARTGHLRRSIRSGVEGDTGWIGTNVDYGKYNEPVRPFLKPSFEGKNLDKIGEIIINGVVKEMTK